MLNHTKGGSHTSDKMNRKYYKKVYKYSNNKSNNNGNLEEKDLKLKCPDPGIFRFYGKPDFDNFDMFVLKEHNWKVAHALTHKQKEFLKTHQGYIDHKETVNYDGLQGHAIMHRNKETDIHKLIINPRKLENYEDTIKIIKNMFELGLGYICYDEKNLPEELKEKIKKAKESKLIKKLESN